MSLTPYVVVWSVLAVVVVGLALYRILAGLHEDDLIHLGPGEDKLIPKQVAFFRMLEVVDRWGKTLTAIVIASGALLGAIALYRAWQASTGQVPGDSGLLGFYGWLEQTSFSIWIRESGSIWAYPLVLTLHTCGMGILVGFNWAIDVRLLGFTPKIPVPAMERFFPVMWIGFWVNLGTGVILLVADATTKMTSWVFGVKMVFIVSAMIVLLLIRKKVFRHPDPDPARALRTGKYLAALSVVFWALSITAGRLMAYLGPVSGLK